MVWAGSEPASWKSFRSCELKALASRESGFAPRYQVHEDEAEKINWDLGSEIKELFLIHDPNFLLSDL